MPGKAKISKRCNNIQVATLPRQDDNSLPLTGEVKQLDCYFEASVELGLLESQPSLQMSRAKALAAGACGTCCLLVRGI